MLRSLDTVPEEYFYQVLAARDAGKRKRLKVFWGSIYLTGLFLLFSSLFVYNSHPRVDYSYYCNLVYIILFAVQVFGCIVISIPGFAGKHQKLYWVFFLVNTICLQIGLINVCVAGMGLEELPYEFFLLMICLLVGAILLAYVVFKRVIERISQGYYKKNDARLFDEKNRKRQRRGVIFSLVISSFTLPLFIFLNLASRLIHIDNIVLLLIISFLSTFLLFAMSFVSYSPILHIYCVNRFPTSEFTAPKIRKNNKEQV